ncbi:MAG: acyl-CoA thioesterase, partial [Acidimicrobiales bacterium]
TRRVVAIQNGRAIFNLQCSFHVAEEGLSHQAVMPEVPGPESLATVAERIEPYRDVLDLWIFDRPRPIDQRFVGALPWLNLDGGEPCQRLWLRADGRLGDDPLLHAAVVAYASDMTLYESILSPHQISFRDDSFMGASLDHCMWFHREFRADEWLLLDEESPVAGGARGIARGLMFSRSGDLVVSMVQEGLLRVKRGAKSTPAGATAAPKAPAPSASGSGPDGGG